MTTHKTFKKDLEKALKEITQLKICQHQPVSIEIQEI